MFRSSAQFDKLLEKATSHLLLEPDWNAILQICDCIRQGDVQAKYAITATKKKLYATNPHVTLFALQVLESCVKNCGVPVHQEIASKTFMEELRELVKVNTNENVRNKILELIQAWAHAFRNEPSCRAVQDTLNLMKMEGYKFPALKECDAMFLADQAPDWAEGDCCHRCRVQFSMVQRKHHCRNCGQIFCNKCSGRNSPIPKYGIEKEVRVCEACWEKLNKPPTTPPKSGSTSEQSPAFQPQAGETKSEQELQEEEELQLAIALSKSEAENKEKEKPHASSVASTASTKISSLNMSQATTDSPVCENNKNDSTYMKIDPELARYLNRGYWEQRQQQQDDDHPHTRSSPVPSAPATVVTAQANNNYPVNKVSEKYQNGELDEMQEFQSFLRSNLEIFVNRMKSNSSRGRPIANDTYVQSLFLNITNMHAQLLKFIQEHDDQRMYFEGLQDKLGQVRDARAALDALREDHRERMQREAEEAERQRQIQMAQKLEIMRKKKQEYLQYQRQIALQRMQEHEHEMQMRQEQQKYQALHQGGQLPPGVFPPPQGSYQPPGTIGPYSHPNMIPQSDGTEGPPLPYQGSYAPPASQIGPYQPPEMPPYSMQGIPGTLPSIHQGPAYTQSAASGLGPVHMVGPIGSPPGNITAAPSTSGPVLQQPPHSTMTATGQIMTSSQGTSSSGLTQAISLPQPGITSVSAAPQQTEQQVTPQEQASETALITFD